VTSQFHKLESEGKVISNITVLLTGKSSDIISLSMLPRMNGNLFNFITIYLPKDFLSFSSEIITYYHDIKELIQLKTNTKYQELDSISTYYDSLTTEILSFQSNFDMFLCAFVEPPPPDLMT
jgi:hypothetical protein